METISLVLSIVASVLGIVVAILEIITRKNVREIKKDIAAIKKNYHVEGDDNSNIVNASGNNNKINIGK